METAYEYFTNEKHAVVCTDEKKVIRHILRLAEEHPDEVIVKKTPEKNMGVLNAEIPRSWIKLPRPPKTRELTEEQRAKAAERLRNARNNHKNSAEIDRDEKDE